VNLDVIALGGNAILPAGQSGTIHEQFAITRVTMKQIAELVSRGRKVVLTHGNGPIVGNIVLRNEALRDRIPPMPLGICVADSQGGIGYMIQQVMRNALRAAGLPHPVVTLVTQVRINEDDPSLENPSKPIGPFYTKQEAEEMRRLHGWDIIEDSNRGYRRVVPSPRPVEIIERDVVRRLVDSGVVVVTVGGGGIPVLVRGDQLDGVEAVVDKDYASAVLARDLEADRLVIVTDVDAVYRDYGKPGATPIREMTADEAAQMAKTLPSGSMGSKLAAAAEFVRARGGAAEVIVTHTVDLLEALEGRNGTRIRLK
jgi:carbamate kinase